MTANPIVVEVTRGPLVESRHRGALAIAGADGRIVLSLGDTKAPVFPRSAVKLLQALPLVESGAARAFAFTDAEIALIDARIRKTTIEKFGPVRSVTPTLVFEIGFEGIGRSPRHKSGIAVRFPRMLRMRDDKPVDEADTLQTLLGLLA